MVSHPSRPSARISSAIFLVSAIVLAPVASACETSIVVSTATPTGRSATPLAMAPTQPVASPVVFVQTANGPGKTTPQIVKELRFSVVHIQTEAVQLDFFNRPIPTGGVGTGEIIDSHGHILTNAHVVQDAQRIRVGLSDGTTVDARIVGTDSETDLAIIRIDRTDLPVIPLGRSSELEVGERVIAIGHALDFTGGPTVTGGLVSALERTIDVSETVTLQNLIQTDAPINPGNSGGPLVNGSGLMVGINTVKVSGGEGIGFAIAIDAALPLVKELIANGRIERGYLGASVATVTAAAAAQMELPVKEGVVVLQVQPGSPAQKAGLTRGDIIVAMAGRPLRNLSDLNRVLFENRSGKSVEVEYYRGPAKKTTAIVLGARPR